MDNVTAMPVANASAYSFRRLKSTDTFLMFKIIGKIGINEFTACFGNDSVKEMIAAVTKKELADNATTMVGISVMLEIANVIVSNLPKCESEIYQLLADVSNLTVKQVKDMEFVPFTEMVLDFVQKEEFRDFVQVVSKRFKSAN